MNTSTDELDALIELSVTEAQLRNGTPLAWVARRSGQAAIIVQAHLQANGIEIKPGVAPRWTEEEDEFLCKNLGWLSEEDIAQILGRSVNAVHLRWDRDLNLPAPSKHPDWIVANVIGNILTIDGHSVMKLIERGLLPARLLPGARKIRVVYRPLLWRWALNPLNWVYFRNSVEDTDRITDPHLRRLIIRQKQRWRDAWWTPGQVASYYGVTDRDVNRYLRRGKIKGSARWGNWWILRSEALKEETVFYKGKGAARVFADWGDDADAFIILARAVGMTWEAIGSLMNDPQGRRVGHRIRTMHLEGEIPALIAKYDLNIKYNLKAMLLLADWRDYRDRFPALTRIVGNYTSGRQLSPQAFQLVRRVLATCGLYHAQTETQERLATKLLHGRLTQKGLYQRYEQMCQEWGFDLLADFGPNGGNHDQISTNR
ncbi:MAG: hypothetical protein BroJett011_42860 [Chloroflexota bacterium]|nr:MAG: hypothetical protein BroJett011_42860 [Chloroflexota bacterium]